MVGSRHRGLEDKHSPCSVYLDGSKVRNPVSATSFFLLPADDCPRPAGASVFEEKSRGGSRERIDASEKAGAARIRIQMWKEDMKNDSVRRKN